LLPHAADIGSGGLVHTFQCGNPCGAGVARPNYNGSMSKLGGTRWAAAIFILGTAVSAYAECVSIPGSLPERVRSSAFVFDGTVLRVDRIAPDGTLLQVDDALSSVQSHPEPWLHTPVYVATIEVHRVWKGNVSRQFKVYFVFNVEGPSFKAGQRRIVFAHVETDEIRKSLRIDPRSPRRDAWVFACSGAASDDEAVIKRLGASRKPSVY
jgi:hypothetical protein